MEIFRGGSGGAGRDVDSRAICGAAVFCEFAGATCNSDEELFVVARAGGVAGAAGNGDDVARKQNVLARIMREWWWTSRLRTAPSAGLGTNRNGGPTIFSRRCEPSGLACAAGARDRFGKRNAGAIGSGNGTGADAAAGGARDWSIGGGLRYAAGRNRWALDGTDPGRCDVRGGKRAGGSALGEGRRI